jgi:hypothetical protein
MKIGVKAISGDGNWEALWDFYPTHCTFSMIKMPADYKYWILYEGTPGGTYDDTDWWMTSAVKEQTPLTGTHDSDIPAPEWIAFGDQSSPRSIFLLHHDDDTHIDTFYQMDKAMTVFGFGRKRIKKFLDTVPQHFSIGIVETTTHEKIAETMDSILDSK